MNVEEAIRRLITGSTMPPSSSVAELVRELTGAYGTRPPAGIPERTWRRARHQTGWKPSPPTLDRLRAAQRVVRARARHTLVTQGSVAIDATIRISNDERRRQILIAGPGSTWTTPPLDMQQVMAFYLVDDLQAAAGYLEATLSGNVDGALYVVEVHGLQAFSTRGAALDWMYRQG